MCLSVYLYNIHSVIIFRFFAVSPYNRHFSKHNTCEFKTLTQLVIFQWLLCFKVAPLVCKSRFLPRLIKSSFSFLLKFKNKSRKHQRFSLTLLEVKFAYFKFFLDKANFSNDSKIFKNQFWMIQKHYFQYIAGLYLLKLPFLCSETFYSFFFLCLFFFNFCIFKLCKIPFNTFLLYLVFPFYIKVIRSTPM